MAVFFVNGTEVTVEKNQRLLRYLRDTLHLTSVKDGCSEGACGACTVLIDGEPIRACTPFTDSLAGRHVITVEGLTDEEMRLYTYAYGEAGAVQCGFCIPGMVLCTKALLDRNLNPTDDQIRYALRNNYCRCTGYVKIMDAVRLAAKCRREGVIPEASENDWKLGSSVHRIDVEEKVLGYGKYPDDWYLPDMCYGSAVRSQYPRARVLAIDASKAEALPGVVRVITAADIPGENKVGHLKHDQYSLIPIGGLTHYLGDAIALVVAETPEILEKAKKLVKVTYEPLPAVHNPPEAWAEDAPRVFDEEESNVQAYKHIARGDADTAIKNSKYVISQHFETPWTEHAFLEPECAVSYIDPDGYVMVLSTDQSSHTTLHECKLLLGSDKVRVQNQLVGGGFGGKEDMSVQHHAALITYLTGRTVKVKLTRPESLLIHPKRHPMDMEFTLGCDENGIIQGVKATVIADTGAYASLGGPVLERACTHAAGPYNYQNFEIDGYAYYTNNPPAGAFRGFGVTQTCFAMESMLNRMAHKIGISPWQIRYINAIRPGQVLPNGQIADASTGLVETLVAVKAAYEGARFAGIACAMKNAGVGVGLPDTGRVRLRVSGGRGHIETGASCIGQGLGTVLMQYVTDELKLPREAVVYGGANSHSPDSGTTSGSRQTLITGEAALRACQGLKADLAEHSLSELEDREYYGEYLAKTDPLGSDKPNPVSHVAYGYATQVAILDEETGRVSEIVAAHDVGRAVNPLSVEGQIEGGVIMSCGFALTEDYPLENCRPTAKYGTLGLFRADNCPRVTSLIIEKPGIDKARGAIGIGEITSIPTAAAIAEAYYARDNTDRYALPLCGTPYSKK